MNCEFKIGDLITYKYPSKSYCIIVKIDRNKIWGFWADSIKRAKTIYKNPTNEYMLTFMYVDECVLIKEHKKITQPYEIVKFCKKYYV